MNPGGYLEMFKKGRKGVSPVIATLLLIVIAVAAAVVTYSWVMGFIGTTTTTPAQTQARIVVDAVSYDSGGPSLTVYVRNVGTTSVNVDAVYVYSADGTLVDADTSPSGGSNIEAGSVATVTASLSAALSSGTYYVKVTTQEGASAVSETFEV